jgi:hypothetical protein
MDLSALPLSLRGRVCMGMIACLLAFALPFLSRCLQAASAVAPAPSAPASQERESVQFARSVRAFEGGGA